MYRYPGENIAFILTIVILFSIGLVLSWIDVYLFAIVFIGILVYVRLTQARYKGDAIRVHGTQFKQIYDVFHLYAKTLGIQKASLYITQDPYLNAFTLGITSCTVVLNSALVEQLDQKEISFVIAHELGHYAAGHTKLSTLFTPLGGGVFSDLVLGFWSRKTEYSSDRCGVILTKDIDSSISAILKLALGGKLFKEINISGYLSQLKDSQDRLVGASELLGSHPLVANRIINLMKFWTEQFEKKTHELK